MGRVQTWERVRQFSVFSAFITVLGGIVPFVILSLRSYSFWPHSSVDVPLTLSPSVLIGDSLLIPLANGFVIPVLRHALRCGIPSRLIRRICLVGISCLVSSTVLNIYLHQQWSQDEYTGFIDPSRGSLSMAGWWHFVFASLELALLSFFTLVCLRLGNDVTRIRRAAVLRVWYIVLAYSTMSIFDMIVMVTIVGRPMAKMTVADNIALLPFLMAASIWFVFNRRLRGDDCAK